MDDFLKKEKCDRCGCSLRDGRIMSMYNDECICQKCKKEEEILPNYKEAEEAEREAEKNGNFNFKGIGLPHKQK